MPRSIRLACDSDAAAIAAIYAPIVRDTVISFESEPPGAAEMAERIRATLAFAPWLVCEVDGLVVGYAYGSRFRTRDAYRWTVETTVYVHADHHRRGIGRELYSVLFELLAIQGFRTVIAGIALPNAASVAAHQSLGFAPVGVFRNVGNKKGAWIDTGFWQLDLGDVGNRPPLPLAPEEAARDPRWKAALRGDRPRRRGA